MRGSHFSYAEEAFAFIESLDLLASPEAVMDAMEKAMSLFGFENFIMTGLPGPRERFEQAVLARKWPEGWFEIYAREDYVGSIRLSGSAATPSSRSNGETLLSTR